MPVTPDGSPVEVYLRLPPRGEAELVHGAIAAGAEILELGCGAGRITHELIRLGHPVVAVDESAEMLEHVRGAETVRARIEELDLGRFAATAEYAVDGRTWEQPFAAVLLDDAELDATLRRAGLTLTRALDESGAWVEARLYSDA